MSKPSIVFFGNERLATGVSTDCPTLRKLHKHGFDVKAVIANYEVTSSRNPREHEISCLAEKLGIPTFYPKNKDELQSQVNELNADVGVLVAFGQIVPRAVIDHFSKGIINIHPSLLPLHRGPTPIESAILDANKKTGVSIMELSEKMDAGPILKQQQVQLTGSESKHELADTLLELGSELVVEVLSEIESLEGRPQNDSEATYDSLISKRDGILDFNKPAEQLEREIRAFAGWPKSRTKLGDIEVVVTKAHVTPSIGSDCNPGDITVVKEANELGVATASGTLWLDSLKPAGKQEMSIADFLRGYSSRL